MFLEQHPETYEPIKARVDSSPMWFPWADTQKRLEAAEKTPTAAYGTSIALGDPAMESIGLAIMELAPGMTTRTHRTTANNVYAVVEGAGGSDVDGTKIEWKRGDVFVAPAWRPHSHRSETGGVLLCVTDEPVMSKLNLLRAQVKPDTGAEWEWVGAKSQ